MTTLTLTAQEAPYSLGKLIDWKRREVSEETITLGGSLLAREIN